MAETDNKNIFVILVVMSFVIIVGISSIYFLMSKGYVTSLQKEDKSQPGPEFVGAKLPFQKDSAQTRKDIPSKDSSVDIELIKGLEKIRALSQLPLISLRINDKLVNNLGVNPGSDVTFSWSTTNAISCHSPSFGIKNLPVNGSYIVKNIQDSKYFDIKCVSGEGKETIESAWISVNLQPIFLTVQSPAGGTYFGDSGEVWRDAQLHTISWLNSANIHSVVVELIYSKDETYDNGLVVQSRLISVLSNEPAPTSLQWNISLTKDFLGASRSYPLTSGFYWIKVKSEKGDLFGINKNEFPFTIAP